ncbi:class II fructose-bisphosphatase [Francisella noatunensis]|uniref:Fructose-1,6-bisphosphatase n=1 Tax=Francisella noatunensis TaxID=657445 RepID=A0A9Q2KRP0_9GAMM|nr:class II fructose-bisphosphatase [Francisella noatunensis]MBK2028477.1 class II fructose-bisphosphatase [Francisella noatunensis]MBK2034498.1 class II fructose-bisphosphatase [Francisella noatunensis]MBK2049068.1 class II fructose-bisphosphatase [Francisella noatunensis]MBK2050050.1 class II fructose-bisphosphatase [Francisella noatunensis]MBK2051562.1 class II fructose-bisphosphatase [Francisella noatunensis]
MNRNVALEAVRVTELAALASWSQMGRGDKIAADQAAVDAMRKALNEVAIDGTVVIGEGELDEAPMLYIGEKVGSGGCEVDIALDPLEGTTITSKGGPNALTVLAVADKGGFLNAPDVYMQKIAVGGIGAPKGIVDLDDSVTENLRRIAEFKGVHMSALVVCTMDRPRHAHFIKEARECGARVVLIDDGDVSGVISTATEGSGIDVFIGTGGAPEGVLSAAALKCLGGQMQARLEFHSDEEVQRAHRLGITDLNKKYDIDDLASGDIVFAATGVTDGNMLRGVKRVNSTRRGSYAVTHSVVMRSTTKTVRHITAEHSFGFKDGVEKFMS